MYTDHAISGGTDQRPGYRALLTAVDRGECRVVMAESLDRLSREQEHVAALLKRCRFAGVRLFTQAEGEVGELHVGLKGTMNALYLVDLADKARRGLRGRVEAGASAGGLRYGCDVVPRRKARIGVAGPSTRLMAPEVYAAFVRGFMNEWNAAQKERAVTQEGWRDEVKRLERKIANFVDTIGEGDGSAAVLSALRLAKPRWKPSWPWRTPRRRGCCRTGARADPRADRCSAAGALPHGSESAAHDRSAGGTRGDAGAGVGTGCFRCRAVGEADEGGCGGRI